ncbi:hypothetical protein CEY16_00420 [Halalkalibacillus sediminis]|uniref:Phospholipase C/D domain-containing protein n=1 Tax=Halalkalibacillus sediminis TaxID=2018042 RepID=A0A2I0QV88_9BACI|nr:zinc dependent phospholipase C family protein [Halalkalibacillus sediminis]PKR78257.1 hypothetical protein CEY16_00420 [Halalkalibacillus sediminis]
MPNIWTHILFCEEAMKSIHKDELYNKYQNHFNLGAQGPDPFFYHNFWPWKNESAINELGGLLHRTKCGDFLMTMVEQAKSARPQTQAYVLGFLTHHILDRNTHPYVHYRSGYEGNKHQLLELHMDTVMLEQKKSEKTWKNPVYKHIDIGKKVDDEIKQVIFHAMDFHYQEEQSFEESSFIDAAYKDKKKALRILFDPTGVKHKFLGNLIRPFSHAPLNDNVDYLNEDRSPWYHPATNEQRTESFLDLYENGLEEAKVILTLTLDYWNDEKADSYQELLDKIGHISYDTGEALHLNLELKYSDPIV